MPLFAVESDEGLEPSGREIGDLLDFLRLQKNAAFAVATFSAFLALKLSSLKCLKCPPGLSPTAEAKVS